MMGLVKLMHLSAWKLLSVLTPSMLAQMVKASACNAGNPGSIPGSGKSSGEGNGNPLQYSCLENLMDGAWKATVHGVTKSQTWLSDFTSLQASFNFMAAITICSDFGAPKCKVSHCFHYVPIYLPWSDGTRCNVPSFLIVSFQPAFLLSSFTFIKRFFSSSPLFAIGWSHLHIWCYWYFFQQFWF